MYVYSQMWTCELIYIVWQQPVNTQMNRWDSYLRQLTFPTAKGAVWSFYFEIAKPEVGNNAEVQPQNTFEIVVS